MNLRFLTAGESHGPALVAILEGMPAGLAVSKSKIDHELARRQRGYGAGPRMKIEKDQVQILGGVLEGVTIGAPVAFLIENKDHAKWLNQSVEPFTIPRPGHADLTGAIKYSYNDLRPALERASTLETAARVAVGSVCSQLLSEFGIQIGGYVNSIGNVESESSDIGYQERFKTAEANDMRCADKGAVQRMHQAIEQIIHGQDTLGGVIEIVTLGLPPGLGSHVQWDRRLESRLAAAVLSVQAMKGVEIGPAFENTQLPGTQVHDAIYLRGQELIRKTNRSGGLEGGITTGQPLVIRVAMKPIATTLTPQQSVDLVQKVEVPTQYERSDFCPVPRAVPILEAMIAFVIADALLEKLGGDSLEELKQRYRSLREAKLDDLPIEDQSHIFWSGDES